jgi:pimeloyl-ACP methyl ester carboxylesterase
LPDTVYVCRFPNSAVMVLVNGTTHPVQYVMQAAGAALVPAAGWRGRVGAFWAQAAGVVASVLAPILEELEVSKAVYVGHSYGGAVATLLAARPAPWRTVGVWTAAAPRCGDGVFAQTFSLPCERWTTPGDPVPLLPPSTNAVLDATLFPIWPTSPVAYVHCGQRFQVNSDGTIDQPAEVPSWTEASNYLFAVIEQQTGWATMHASTNYACRIRKSIPVDWRASDPAWPRLDQVDAIYSTLLADSGGMCPEQVWTQTIARDRSGPRFARQGNCK